MKPNETMEMLAEKLGYFSMHTVQCLHKVKDSMFLYLALYQRCVEKIEECAGILPENRIGTKTDLSKVDSCSEVIAEMVEELMEKQTVFDFCKREHLDYDWFDDFYSDLIELYMKYQGGTKEEKRYLNAYIREGETYVEDGNDGIYFDEFASEFFYFFDEKLKLFLDEKDREEKFGYEFVELLCTHLFCQHTVEEVLDDPDIICSAWCFIKETLTDDGYGYRSAELILRVYKSEWLYGKKEVLGKISTPLKDVQEYPLISGVLVSEKEKAVYLYLTEHAFLLEEVFDLSHTFLNLFIGVRGIEGGKK